MVPAAAKINPRGAPTITMQAPQCTHQSPEKNRDTTPAERRDLQQIALTCLCHVQTVQELPKIWSYIAPLKKEKSHTALEISCHTNAGSLQLNPPNITHMVSVLLLGLAFHTEDPDRVSDAMNIFMLPDLSLAAGKEAALLAWQWDTAVESNTLTPYSNTAALMAKQRITPIFGWEGADKMLKQWLVLLDVILGPPKLHPAVHKLGVLLEATEEVNTCLREQAYHQPDFPAAPIGFI